MQESKSNGKLYAFGAALFIALAMLALSGCPALMVPGLAYSGYKAMHTSTSSSSAKAKSPSSHHHSSRAASNNSIE